MQQLTLGVNGMACGGCSGTVKQALLALDGVAEAEVSHVEARAVVSYDPALVTPEQISAAIAAAGYQVAN